MQTLSQLPVYRDRHLTLLTDLYQLTMMYGQFCAGRHEERVVFDLFYRQNPCGNGYVIAAGLEQAAWYLSHLHFTDEDLAYLRSLQMFSEAFLDHLKDFRFSGDLYAVPEGTVVFPNEPIIRVEGPVLEVQLIESAILSFVNHQSLIATKARRIVEAAETNFRRPGSPVIEMGLRRAQNIDASVFGARAAFIGGCVATSNVMAAESYNLPVVGTQAHSWIQSFSSELESFRGYADAFPDDTVLLVDTYDVLRSGVPNAIIVGKELAAKGHQLKGIRIDSGDLAYLSKRARQMLDAAGLTETAIVASSDLDEYTIRDLVTQGAEIDTWGVGTHLITSSECPALGCVYKLVAEEVDGRLEPRIKVSENPSKVTNPGKKKLLRLYVEDHAVADLITLWDEVYDPNEELELFDPIHTYKRKVISNYKIEELLIPVFIAGKLVYDLPDIATIQKRVEEQLKYFSSEVLRHLKPHEYHVDLSQQLWDLKQTLLRQWQKS
ncbi:nicotinate phosphoribosyltransferase [Alicyclobacillus fodiniaquatilis]|uniref:Nicotinate phosphoribosyltransferase n=1 Tax=Alicyclobacillus fodiniaquatilis TaxID=1661150 RepID=A0ABW4JDA5_9BACL